MAPGLKPSRGWCQWLHVLPGVVVGVPDIHVSQDLSWQLLAMLLPPPFPQKLNRSPSCKRSKYHLMGKVSIWFFESSATKKCCDAKASQVSPVNSPLILAGTFWVMTGLVMVTLPGTLLSSGIPETTLHSWKLVKKRYKKILKLVPGTRNLQFL